MPAQKRPHPSSAGPAPAEAHVQDQATGAAASATEPSANGNGGGPANGAAPELAKEARRERERDDGDSDAGEEEQDQQQRDEEGGGGNDEDRDDDDDDDDSQSSQSDGADMDEFILVKLMDIRKEVQCPICLGIIRKTRTVMECLHRFCRDCIDKSMRLGNNECPACRTHCKSRRSLRDDPNFDALILALYPDIDKYEEEELAFGEEEKTRNKKIQESIAETYRRQSEALVKKRSTAKAIATTRKTRGNMRTKRRGRNSSPDIAPTDIDEEEEREENGNEGSKESSSVDDRSPEVKVKRARRWPVPRSSPAKIVGSVESSYEENDDMGGARDILATSPLRGEMLAWGKNGTRSQTRHGSGGGSSGRMVKGGRVAKLVDHLRNADEFDSKLNLYLVLAPLDGQSMPKLEKSYLSCQPTFSVRHLCQFVALQLSRQAKEVEIYFRKSSRDGSLAKEENGTDEAMPDRFDCLERLKEEKSLSELYPSFASGAGDLELLYSLKTQG